MANLLEQLRVRFSGLGQENQEDPYNKREGRIPPQKTVSFKGERNKTSWSQRQFSDQMSEVDGYSDQAFETAVAAAAFAITSLEEGSPNQKKSDEELRRSLTKTKSKKEESTDKPIDYGKISRWFTGKEAKEDGRSAGESSMGKSATLDPEKQWPPGKAMATTPSVKKTPTFSDKYLNDTGSKRLEPGQGSKGGQITPSTIKPKPSLSGNGNWDGTMIDSSKVETKADAWEKAKMAKIKKRYEKQITTILEWENEKKTKAKKRMERKEREIEERRARVIHEYRNEIARIDKVVGGARAVANERKRNDESKTIEKAKVFRSTGKVPKEGICF